MPLKEKLTSGEFVILAEVEPPKGTDVSDLVAEPPPSSAWWTPLWSRR